ncbi:MAG: PH domain-containing protein [Chloroflexota bacterium]
MAAAMVVLGAMQGDPVTVAMGAGLLVYVWFTQHRRYEIFQERLVIRYGTPRIRSVPLADIAEVRLVKAPLGGQDLLVVRKGRGVIVIRPRDADGFAAALGEARGVSSVGRANKAEVRGRAGRQPEAQANKRARSRNRRSRSRKS